MKNKALTFSYDDGITQDKQLVRCLNRYHLKATFNLNTGIQTRENHFDINGKEIYRMDQQEIGSLYDGHEIAVHGLTHASPLGKSEAELDIEYGQDIQNITEIYGKRPIGMAYAYGDYDQSVINWLGAHGICYGRTTKATHSFELPRTPLMLASTCHHNDEALFDLADRFINEQPAPGEKWLFYVWGHSYEFYVNDNWDRLEAFCRLLSNHDDIFYGTNRECLSYFQVI